MDHLLQKMMEEARGESGSAYVFGARGEMCTPSTRRRYAARFPTHANIVKACQVLSGKSENCNGCRYKGRRVYDCRGFTAEMWKRASGYMIKGAGATSQWNNNDNWTDKGELSTLPNKPCVLFCRDANRPKVMAHTGLYDGAGGVSQCGGYGGTGVHYNPIRSKHWTHWAMPGIGAKNQNGLEGNDMTLELGARGTVVKNLQKRLKEAGYNLGTFGKLKDGVDGVFGLMTLNAVKDFQRKHNLTIDGVWGREEEAAINLVPGQTDLPRNLRVVIANLSESEANEIKRRYPQAVIEM